MVAILVATRRSGYGRWMTTRKCSSRPPSILRQCPNLSISQVGNFYFIILSAPCLFRNFLRLSNFQHLTIDASSRCQVLLLVD